MAQTSTFSEAYSPSGSSLPALLAQLGDFYRRWFAAETIYNPRALDEIGLGFLARNRA